METLALRNELNVMEPNAVNAKEEPTNVRNAQILPNLLIKMELAKTTLLLLCVTLDITQIQEFVNNVTLNEMVALVAEIQNDWHVLPIWQLWLSQYHQIHLCQLSILALPNALLSTKKQMIVECHFVVHVQSMRLRKYLILLLQAELQRMDVLLRQFRLMLHSCTQILLQEVMLMLKCELNVVTSVPLAVQQIHPSV